jgi:ankyrin repeat protein
MALYKEYEECARMLLKVGGIDYNAVDSFGAAPLHVAATISNPDMVSLLLSKTDINVRLISGDDDTALQIATYMG